jgi:hypothetical protein
MRTTPVLATGVAVLALGVVGCGAGSSSGGGQAAKPVNPNGAEANPAGDIPDNQAYVAYMPPGGGFSVKVPEGWGRSDAGGAVTFTDKLNSINMETRAAKGPLSVARARATELPQLSKSVKGFQPGTVTQVSRKAGTAIRITYLADGRPDAVTGKVTREAVERYLFAQKGKEVVLTLSGPKGADNVDPWKIVTDSLRWKR